MRRLIWKAACSDSRLFELQQSGQAAYTPQINYLTPLTISPGNTVSIHSGISISLHSRYPPPVLFLVSKEAEIEAKTVYKLVELNDDIIGGRAAVNTLGLQTRQARTASKCLWFNPFSDILYFGPRSCLGTMLSTLKSGIPIHRIALELENIVNGDYGPHACCGGELKHQSCLQPFLGPQANYLTRRLRFLHGFTPLGATKRAFPGCPSLDEVFLLMNEASPFDPENLNTCVEFEKYTAEKPHYPLVGNFRLSMAAYTQHVLTTALSSFPEKE
jgi:hypothetical protein